MPNTYALKVVDWFSDDPCPIAGQYLERLDPHANARGGAQCMWFTPDIAKAQRFPNITKAVETWKQPLLDADGNELLRADGRPDRPLTAFSVEFAEVPDAT